MPALWRHLFVLCALLFAGPALAQEPQRILGFALGDSAPDPDNFASMKEAFGAEIAEAVTGLGYTDSPLPRYQVELKDNRELTIWFDDDQPDRPIYRIKLLQEGAAIAELIDPTTAERLQDGAQ